MTSEDPIATFYERYPYPERRVDELDCQSVVPSNLPMVAHYVFGGRIPRDRPFRVLVAGGGTGDAVLAMGQGMRRFGVTGSIDCLDLAEPSLAIARERARRAGLQDVAFHRAPIESLAEGAAARFDYVDLCGVLNHVPDPAAALAALSHALAPEGGIGVMAYGALGRTGVYEAQEALRLLGADATSADGLGLARAFAASLPRDNWLAKNPAFETLARADDAELADVLLNPRDRAFSTDRLVDLTEAAGLGIRAFVPPFLYDPAVALREPALREAASDLDHEARWRLAELLQGCLNKHVFYAVKAGAEHRGVMEPSALLDDPETLLVPHGTDLSATAAALAALPEENRSIRVAIESRVVGVGVRLSALDLGILAAIDGPTRVGAVRDRHAGTAPAAIAGSLRRLIRVFSAVSMLHVMAG